ncbi:hypothetical protein ABT255_24340 [Streptomyces mirabilis]
MARRRAAASGGVFGPAGVAEVCARVLGESRHGLDSLLRSEDLARP